MNLLINSELTRNVLFLLFCCVDHTIISSILFFVLGVMKHNHKSGRINYITYPTGIGWLLFG